MTLAPFADRICVRKIEEKKEDSAIIIPTAVSEKQTRQSVIGEVIAVGPCVDSVEAGDIVMFSNIVPWAIPKIKILTDYENCVILNEEDIFATLGGVS